MKTAVVTGGTRGIGRGIANALARDGHHLVLGYNANETVAHAARDQISREHGVQVVCVPGDIAAPGTNERLFAAVREHFGGTLTAFVHNAGLYVGITTAMSPQMPDPAGDDFEARWDYYQRVYPRAFKRGLLAALACEGLRHVVAISSPGCNATQPPQLTYEEPGQAKASVELLVRLHARALADKGITVNAVIPGFVKTGAWDGIFDKTDLTREAADDWMRRCTPAQRWAEPDEIGHAVAFLCSDAARFITGVALPVDGGLHLHG